MVIGQILPIIDKDEVSNIMIEPTDKVILGAKPGNFVSINIYDGNKLQQIADEEIKGISAYNNIIVIKV